MNVSLVLLRRIIIFLFAMSLTPPQAADSATLQGRFFLAENQFGNQIEVVLKQGRKTISRLIADEQNSYKFENLANGRYQMDIYLRQNPFNKYRAEAQNVRKGIAARLKSEGSGTK